MALTRKLLQRQLNEALATIAANNSDTRKQLRAMLATLRQDNKALLDDANLTAKENLTLHEEIKKHQGLNASLLTHMNLRNMDLERVREQAHEEAERMNQEFNATAEDINV